MRVHDSHSSLQSVLLLGAVLSIPACEALEGVGRVTGAIFGSVLTAVANNYAPGHAQAVQALVSAIVEPSGTTAAAPASRVDEDPLALDVALLRQTSVDGQDVLEPMEDGDVLRDGRGDLEAGDRFRVAFRANHGCFLYVIGVDATGWVTPLFPSVHTQHTNPIAPDTDYQLPDPEYAYSLNEHRGIEHIYFVTSMEARPDIESLLESFEGQEQPAPTGTVRVDETAVVERGVTGRQSGLDLLVQTALGGQNVETTSFLAGEGTSDLVITRWFHHE